MYEKAILLCYVTGNLLGFTDLRNVQNSLRDYENVLKKKKQPEHNLAKHNNYASFHGPMDCSITSPIHWLHFFCSLLSHGKQLFEIVELAGFSVIGVACDGATTNSYFYDIRSRDALTFKSRNVYSAANSHEMCTMRCTTPSEMREKCICPILCS